jgi:DNA mismatch repair ATPase MutL
LKDPFIRLNIRCPPGTYDPNVEPSKDSVLFTDEQTLLSHFKSFLETIYPASRHRTDGVAIEIFEAAVSKVLEEPGPRVLDYTSPAQVSLIYFHNKSLLRL